MPAVLTLKLLQGLCAPYRHKDVAMNLKTRTYAWQGIDRSGTHVSGHSSGQNSALVKALLWWW